MRRAVACYDAETNEKVGEYRSMVEAAQMCHTTSSQICEAVRGRAQTAGGYKWRLLGDKPPEKVNVTPNARLTLMMPVIRIDPRGKIERFENASLAIAATPYSSAQRVINCCMGQQRTCSGYRFFYEKDIKND